MAAGSPAIGAADDGSDAGVFSGIEPYILSGMPPVPSFYAIENGGRIRISFGAKSHDKGKSTIRKIQYDLAKDGQIIDRGRLEKIEQGSVVSYTFRPRLGKVVPGETYNLYLVANDINGRRNVPASIDFIAETVNVSGTIFDSNNIPATVGLMYLFEINSEGRSFDTLTVALNDNGTFNFTNVVVGDYLAMGFADTINYPNDLPTYFERSIFWEEADTLLIDQNSTTLDITVEPKPVKSEGEGEITGFLEEEIQDGGGRLMRDRIRIANAGVSVRRARRTGKTENNELELVAHVYTDKDGNFSMAGLPQDTYYLNIQYPGYPMDPESFISFELGSGTDSKVNIQAVVKESKITVNKVEITGIYNSEGYESVKIYPNPASNQLHVDLTDHQDVTISIYSVEGLLLEQHQVKNENKEVFNLDISKYKSGIYILNIMDSSGLKKAARVVIE